MPIYEYRCSKCGGVIEKIQKFSDPPLKRHSGCGGTLSKLISQSSFQLKGSGWYVTDYARKGSAEKADGKNGAAEPAPGKDTEKKAATDDATVKKSTPKDKTKGSSSTGDAK